MDEEPKIGSEPGPTVLPTLAVLAFAGGVDALRERILAAKQGNSFESEMESTLETAKPLSLAVGSGNVEKVQLLLDAGANPDGDDGDSPIESTALVNTHCLPDDAAMEMAKRWLQRARA